RRECWSFVRCRADRLAVGSLAAVLVVLAASRTRASAVDSPADLRARVRDYRVGHETDIVRELADLVAIPNLAADSSGIEGNASRIVSMLGLRGVRTQLLRVAGAPPAVFGELPAPGARRTLLLYAHYDGQPVDAGQWSSDPWKPVLRDAPLDRGGKEVPWS